ncbi:MAG: TIR domain-containing protein [Ekhidna sp.]|nr:TIR domain-containing protein [Ekhidna sp.]
MSKTYKIFISHSWEYSDAYEKLCEMLNNKTYFSYKNHSVPKDDPVHTNGTDKELKNAITNKMYGCHIVLIMAGKYSTYSKWIKKEIDIAKNGFTNSKPIVGIKPWANTQVSSVVSDNAYKMVGWNTNSIVQAIRDHAL